MRERDEDLQKKYPKLNLNEDISELDGVPAVELTDGSVLPILDRDRYPTHVSFIEGNRIDVDDLRSGGWIGDGVYDPCGGCLNLRIFMLIYQTSIVEHHVLAMAAFLNVDHS